MYYGKPVIASITGGPDSFVNESNGILVPVENIEKTADAMQFVLSNYSKYNTNTIEEFARNNFSADCICEQIHQVYMEVLKQTS